MANLGAEGVMKSYCGRLQNHGSNIECGSGCGIMIKAVGIGSHSAESLLL